MAGQPIGEFHENSVNYELGKWLNTVGRDWIASGERTGVIVNSNRRPRHRHPAGRPNAGDSGSRMGKTGRQRRRFKTRCNARRRTAAVHGNHRPWLRRHHQTRHSRATAKPPEQQRASLHHPTRVRERPLACAAPACHSSRPGEVAEEHFSRLSEMRLEPFAYCFRDEARHEIDNVVAEMLGLDPKASNVQEMLEHYRVLFASEPNVNGYQKSIVNALNQYLSSKSAQ